MKKCVIAGLMILLANMGWAEETVEAPVESSGLLLWQDNSLTLLSGTKFEVDPEYQTTITYEHASGWSMGDLFFFADGYYYNGDDDYKGHNVSYYAELAPRLSAGKILNKDLSFLFVKDILIAGCYEFGENSTENLLVGPAVDLNIPGFDFFQLNFYRRFDDHTSSVESYQITPVWKVSIPVGQSTFIFDGFIDYVFGEGVNHLHFCPQLKFDIGVLLGMEKLKLFAGVEYDYWNNKYGINDGDFGIDSDQSAISGLVKYHF